ncbi:MAG: type II toxin-antitoxin system VapB family antitoxin [Terriglobales bacterium]
MKRTNLVLDTALLEEARRTLGAKTYSAAVNQALAEIVRIRKVEDLANFFGSGIWEGDLNEMRQDRRPRAPHAAAAARARH